MVIRCYEDNKYNLLQFICDNRLMCIDPTVNINIIKMYKTMIVNDYIVVKRQRQQYSVFLRW